MNIVVAGRQQETVPRICHAVLGEPPIESVSREPGRVAEILGAVGTERARTTCPAEPWDAHTLPQLEIQETRIAHKNGDTGFPAAQTACQQSCPAGAISFGNGIDPASAVARQAANPRAFRVLAETGVDPSIAYLAKVRTRPGGVGGEHDSGAGGHAGATHDAQGGGHGEGS